jgi:predicted metalloprotease with PDZ domain
MRRGGAIVGALLAAGAAPPPTDGVAYSVAPVMEGAALTALAVELRFRGDADGDTRLQLPDRWAGTDGLWKAVADLRVEGASVSGSGAERRLAHAPGAALVVRYRLASNGAADPGPDYQKAQPIVRPGWFFFHGEGLFAMPEGRDASRASFRWQGWPAAWRLASDLDHLATKPGTVADVVESAALGGPDVELVTRQVDGAPFRLAMRGGWTFTPAALADRVAAVMRAENHYWGDAGRAFFVPVAPLATDGAGRSTNGTGRTDGFAIASTTNFRLEDATQFLAHEYMHSWVGREIGGAAPGDNEAVGYWITEGFTDFLGARALVRAGIWSLEDYAREQNKVLLRLAVSPARRLANAELAERFWRDGDAQQLPYDRGNIFALWADQRLGGRLDDALRRQRRLAPAAGAIGAPALFPRAVREATGVDLTAAIDRFITHGEPLELPPRIFCLTVATVPRLAFDRGFDIEATMAADMTVTGVDPAGAAHAAGLRDGMKLVRREAGEIGNAEIDLVYRVVDAGRERLIRYRPAARRPVEVQQLQVPALGAADRRACAAKL